VQSGQVTKTGADGRPLIVPNRWTLIRDVLVFQVKLAVDGFRDLIMMPISLGVAVLDLFQVGPRAGRQFYDLLKVGRQTEHWINLFGATDHAEPLPVAAGPGIDALVKKMERLVVQEYERGGITSSAKDTVDRVLDGISDRPPGK
jgi:hypothetical protein